MPFLKEELQICIGPKKPRTWVIQKIENINYGKKSSYDLLKKLPSRREGSFSAGLGGYFRVWGWGVWLNKPLSNEENEKSSNQNCEKSNK